MVEKTEEEKNYIRCDIADLEIAQKAVEIAISSVNAIDEFKSKYYNQLIDIYNYIDNLKIQKETELEMEFD